MRGRQTTTQNPQNISEDTKKDIRNVFKVFDPQGEGFISLQEVHIALQALDLSNTREEMQSLAALSERGLGRPGMVRFQEFYNFAAQKIARRKPEEEYHRAFKLFDVRDQGYVSFDDLQRRAQEVGEILTDEEVREMIEEADMDGDGFVSEEDFVKLLRKTERILARMG